MLGLFTLPFIQDAIYQVAVADLQVQLNRWARYLGVEPLVVDGSLDKKTVTFLAQITVAYAPSIEQVLFGQSLADATTEEKIAALVEAARILGVYAASYEVDVVVVPPEEGTLFVVQKVQEKNIELEAAGEPPIPEEVVGGGFSWWVPWAWAAAGIGAVAALGFVVSRRSSKRGRR